MERLTKQESRKTKRILEAKFGMFLVCCKLITLLFRNIAKGSHQKMTKNFTHVGSYGGS